MAENSKEELVQLIKRFGAYKSVNFTNTFSISVFKLNPRSAGAIAEPQRRPKRRAATTYSSAGSCASNASTLVSPGACSASEDSRAQDVADQFLQPLTLGHIVRQKLSEGRKVTCHLLGIVLEESSPEELQKQATVKPSVLQLLVEISKYCDLYLMERVLDNKSEVLFYSIENGRSSFVRQLEPDWHTDTNFEIISQLSRFIKYQLHISPTWHETTASNVFEFAISGAVLRV